jgi:hypothetical protein
MVDTGAELRVFAGRRRDGGYRLTTERGIVVAEAQSWHKLRLVLDAVVAASAKPIRLVVMVGQPNACRDG